MLIYAQFLNIEDFYEKSACHLYPQSLCSRLFSGWWLTLTEREIKQLELKVMIAMFNNIAKHCVAANICVVCSILLKSINKLYLATVCKFKSSTLAVKICLVNDFFIITMFSNANTFRHLNEKLLCFTANVFSCCIHHWALATFAELTGDHGGCRLWNKIVQMVLLP